MLAPCSRNGVILLAWDEALVRPILSTAHQILMTTHRVRSLGIMRGDEMSRRYDRGRPIRRKLLVLRAGRIITTNQGDG